jgi:putative phosphoribosyl transferase
MTPSARRLQSDAVAESGWRILMNPKEAMRADEQEIRIDAGGAILAGNLVIPEGATGIVLFAHGSGSGRHSPRNRQVAEALQRRGLATLLLDLLTADEEALDAQTAHLRFDIDLLAQRLVYATDEVQPRHDTRELHIGYFGASTGAAAAARPKAVHAIVPRGGRVDLARATQPHVAAPTLLIVGGDDEMVVELNRDALQGLRAVKKLVIIPRASHLFEEPGALAEVARLAGNWFLEYLGGPMEA